MPSTSSAGCAEPSPLPSPGVPGEGESIAFRTLLGAATSPDDPPFPYRVNCPHAPPPLHPTRAPFVPLAHAHAVARSPLHALAGPPRTHPPAHPRRPHARHLRRRRLDRHR